MSVWRGNRQGNPAVVRTGLLALVLAIWEVGARTGRIDWFIAPAPSEIALELRHVLISEEFAGHLVRTGQSFFTALGIALILGIPGGVLLWRARLLGETLEPYLVTFRAIPTLVFYPVLLAVLGLNARPIIAISTSMALIPIVLYVMIALRSINPSLVKLCRSLGMPRIMSWYRVYGPAATPLAFPGVKQGFIFALTATIAMEFILSNLGLGFRIKLSYDRFEIATMYAYLVIVVLASIVGFALLTAIERALRRDLL